MPLQVLRSVDRWSAGLNESSIYQAYLSVIEGSQHYLYIEVGGRPVCEEWGGDNLHSGVRSELCMPSEAPVAASAGPQGGGFTSSPTSPASQNQFFISCADRRNVHNTVGDAIISRVLRAHRSVQRFQGLFLALHLAWLQPLPRGGKPLCPCSGAISYSALYRVSWIPAVSMRQPTNGQEIRGRRFRPPEGRTT